jgi:hypothetical protein
MMHDLLSSEAAPRLCQDSIWDRLLDSLNERSVVPIVGPDLLHVEVNGTATLLDQYIARRLTLSYQLPADYLPAERSLDYVVGQLLRTRKDRYGIFDPARTSSPADCLYLDG